MTDKNVRPIWSDEDLDLALGALRAEEADEPSLVRSRIVLMENAGKARRWGGWGGALAAAAAVLALIAGGVIAQQTISADADPSGSVPSEASERLMAAAAKITKPDPVPAPGQYAYQLLRERDIKVQQAKDYKPRVTPMFTTPPPGTYVTPEPGDFATSTTTNSLLETDIWAPARNADVWRMRFSHKRATYPSVGPEKLYGPPTVQTKSGRCGHFGDPAYACKSDVNSKDKWDRPTPEFLASLPREPEKMLALLRREIGSPIEGDAAMLSNIQWILTQPRVPADVRRAILGAVALMPNLRVVDNVADVSGRIGTAFGLEDRYYWDDLIVDERTGAYLGRRWTTKVDATESGRAGTVISWTSFHRAIVDRIGQRP